MTIAYNEHLSATQPAWVGQQSLYRTHGVQQFDDVRDVRIAQRRISGAWLSEDDVLGALERTDG